jgi:tRNA modification GTPase
MSHPDTIVAAATPPGRGGIGIVRLSGAKTPEIAAVILGELPVARRATLARFADADNQTIDVGLALFFPAPHSYTGEHMLELQGHGGPLVIESLITRIQDLGARRALPGEFTQRAFLNDKVDLTQAEAICDLIDAGSSEAARAAMRSLQGEFSAMVHGLTEGVVEVRTHVEAAIDFPDEDIDPLADRQVQDRLQAVLQHFAAIEQSARQGRLLRDGMTVVLAGPPNAGKSSLLNRLAGYDAAIVTPHPGTTRDVLRERIHIDGMPLHVLDTAGLRAANDVAEEEGIRRARAEMARADRVLFVIDAADDGAGSSYVEARPHLPRGVPVTLLFNKCDLARGIPLDDTVSGPPRLAVSALTGAGLDALRAHLKACMGYSSVDAGTVSARQRHLDALARARRHVEAARELIERREGELVAQELRDAQQCLGEITGEVTAEDLLGRIFASFCVGK